MKQTAVEWLEDAVDRIIETYDVDMMRYPLEKAYEQAKEMERQEKNNIYNESYALGLKHGKQMYRGGFDGADGLIIV